VIKPGKYYLDFALIFFFSDFTLGFGSSFAVNLIKLLIHSLSSIFSSIRKYSFAPG